MRARLFLLCAGLLIVGAALYAVVGCSDPVAITANECKGNHRPQIGNLRYFLNGNQVTDPPTVHPSDELKVWIQYQDSDCNLGGGSIWWSIDGGDFAAVKKLPGDLSCQGVGGYRGVFYLPDLSVLASGEHTFKIGLTDVCGATSNTLDGAFTEVGSPVDDDTTGDDDTSFDSGLIVNGDFENQGDSWNQSPSDIITTAIPSTFKPLPSGDWAALMDDSAKTMTLGQEFLVPSDATSVLVEFEIYIWWYAYGSSDADDNTLTVELLDNANNVIGDPLYTFTKHDAHNRWLTEVKQTDLTAYRNHSIKLRFQSQSSGSGNITYYVLDNVAILPL
jgi:hypothetical protein